VTDTIGSHAKLWHRSITIACHPRSLMLPPIARRLAISQNQVLPRQSVGLTRDQARLSRSGNARPGEERPDESISRMKPRFRMPAPHASIKCGRRGVEAYIGRPT
jgi:hypothetical protein